MGLNTTLASPPVAHKVHQLWWGVSRLSPKPQGRKVNKDYQIRFTAGLLLLLTVAAAAFAWINFQKEREFQVPTDGVWWVEHGNKLVAERVETGGPAEKAGLHQGDLLTAINQLEVKNTAALERQLYRTGPWSKATFS